MAADATKGFAPWPHVVLAVIAWLVVAALTFLPDPPPVAVLDFTWGDKLAHFGVWCVLAIATWRAFLPRRPWLAWALCMGYGVVVELVQMPIPGRGGEVGDAVADGLGAAFGVMMMMMWERRQ